MVSSTMHTYCHSVTQDLADPRVTVQTTLRPSSCLSGVLTRPRSKGIETSDRQTGFQREWVSKTEKGGSENEREGGIQPPILPIVTIIKVPLVLWSPKKERDIRRYFLLLFTFIYT